MRQPAQIARDLEGKMPRYKEADGETSVDNALLYEAIAALKGEVPSTPDTAPVPTEM